MNLRALTLKYMGWCPGVKSAAQFIPKKDVSSKIFLLSAVAFISIIGYSGYTIAQYYLRPPETGPLTVTIYDKKDPEGTLVTYPDDMFDESFNYSELRDKRIEFNIYFEEDYSKTGKKETQIYEFERLEDVYLLLDELGTPRIVIGFAGWLSNGSFDEVYRRFYGYGPWEREDIEGVAPQIHLLFGVPEVEGCRFEVRREPVPGVVASYVNGFDGIYVFKMKLEIGRMFPVWTLYFRLNDAPPFSTILNRYPHP
jgi:hypothetical protein